MSRGLSQKDAANMVDLIKRQKEEIELERQRTKVLVEAIKRLIDSIKWSGDINEVNIAPKITGLRFALKKYEGEK